MAQIMLYLNEHVYGLPVLYHWSIECVCLLIFSEKNALLNYFKMNGYFFCFKMSRRRLVIRLLFNEIMKK
jgi:hypothetical protein